MTVAKSTDFKSDLYTARATFEMIPYAAVSD